MSNLNSNSRPLPPPLTLCLLTQEPLNDSNRRLLVAAKHRGHTLIFLETRRLSMAIDQDQTEIFYQEMPLLDFIRTHHKATAHKSAGKIDGVIPRIGGLMTKYGTHLVRHFEQNGIVSLTPASAITIAADKFHAHQVFARHNIPSPPTAFAMAGRDQSHAINLVGGAPVVIKLLSGTGGKGVMLANTKSQALAIMDGYNALYADIMVQAYVEEAKGSDIRAFVIGDQVVGAMQRTAASGEFRSNLHLGGTASAVKLTEVESAVAVKTANALGLCVAGIDLLRTKNGPLLLEANASPGLAGIETATNTDIADLIIQALEHKIASVIDKP